MEINHLWKLVRHPNNDICQSNYNSELMFEKCKSYPLCRFWLSETKVCPIQSRTSESTRNRERPKMKGLRRPHRDVHTSDQCPITGTVNNATNGAEKISNKT